MISHEFVSPGRFIDNNAPEVIAFARQATAGGRHGDVEAAVIVYQAVRVVADFRATYPALMSGAALAGDFRAEAIAGAN